MSGTGRALASVAAALAAAAAAIPIIAKHEGVVLKGYRDPVGIATNCTGHTGPEVIVGKAYTMDECMAILAKDASAHGLDIAKCLPADLPVKTHAAFVSFAFNIGASSFCSSTLSRKARAGDLVGACNELPRWTRAGGRELPGLVKRRAEEMALCLEGVASLRPRQGIPT